MSPDKTPDCDNIYDDDHDDDNGHYDDDEFWLHDGLTISPEKTPAPVWQKTILFHDFFFGTLP